MNKKAFIAMSGGVDSSVAAYLMKQRGYDCAGVTMKLFDNDVIGADKNTACCSLAGAQDAESVAHKLDIPHYVFNFTNDFKIDVIDRFIAAYQNGLTPNPCIDCNRYLKFERLFRRAMQLDADCIATGHYAKTEYDVQLRRYVLKKASDASKDQSYALYHIRPEQLERICFPLGEYKKSDVRGIAEKQGFINAKKRDSQDICFVPNGDYAGFIENYTGEIYKSGDFVDTDGNVLGRHKGLIRYTVGQRKKLGLALEKPMYVCRTNTEDNTVTLCEAQELFTNSLIASDFNWVSYTEKDFPARVKAKIRYKHTESWATAKLTARDTVHIEFDEPQRAITKGQAAVLYDGDIVVGGGTIV